MGKKGKTKKKTETTITTENKLIKLSYVQTLSITDSLSQAEDFSETNSSNSDFSSSKKKTGGGYIGAITKGFGKSKTKTKVNTKTDSTGAKIKDQFLQPYFDRIRYAIGIKELSVSKYKFAPTSEFISVPYLSPKEIVKAHIVVDQYIPPSFDQSTNWIKYYVKPEGESEWIRLNPLDAPTRFDESGLIVPKIINFNLPKPTTSQLEDKFNYTDTPVKKIRFRAVITRPEGGNNDSITPMVKSYRLVMVPRI
jgi:hypothetical protein